MSKKVLSLVLALVMVLGSFSFVSAAAYEDVTDADVKNAVDRLSLLEILEGYPDGTFKPGNTITRAEFAAVAVRAKGLADAANASKGLATGFTDVAPDHWAAGYITTAGKLGVVNGVGNGLFAPGADVKYEEAVTMIVRALGYEAAAQTKGGYPYGYLIVANEIGLLDEVKGTQGAPATRGIVAQITDNALEIAKMIQVGFGSDAKWVVSGSKEHGDDTMPQYLLHDLGVNEIKGHVTNTFRTKSTVKAKEIEIEGTKYDITEGVDTDAVLGVGVTAWAKDDVVFSISLGYKIKQSGKDIVFDEDQVVYDRVVAGDTTKDEAYLYKLDDEYEWASKARIYVNNDDVEWNEIPDKAYGRFVLNDDDEIEFAYLFSFETADTGLVTKIDKTDLEYVNLNADDDVLELDDADEIYVFNKDLSAASLDDIEEDTAVFYWIDSDDNYYIVALNETLEGTLEAVRVRDSRLTVEGTNVKFEEKNAMFSVDGEDFTVLDDFEDIEEYVDEEVIVYYNLVGDTLALVTEADATVSKIYGVATWLTSQRNPVLSVYTQEGKEVDYTFEETDEITSGFKALFANGEPKDVIGVEFKVNKDGEIKEETFEFETAEHDFNKSDDKKYGVYDEENLYITEDTVVLKAYNNSGKLKPSVIKYENIINKEIKDDNAAVVILDKGNDLALLIFTESAFQATDDTEYGIITSDPVRRGSDYRAEIDVYGKGKETYTLSSAANDLKLRTGDLISFELNDKGEVVNVDEIVYRSARGDSSVYEVVSKKDGNYITTEDGTYRNAKNTVVYSVNKAGSQVSSSNYSRIAKGSVLLLIEDDNELKVVLDITAYVGAQDPKDPTDTGVVTYISEVDSVIMIDKEVYELSNTVTLFDADGKLVAAGKANVLKALTEDDVIKEFTARDGVISSLTAKTLQGKEAADKLATAKKALEDAIKEAKIVLDETNEKLVAAQNALKAENATVESLKKALDELQEEVAAEAEEGLVEAIKDILKYTATNPGETSEKEMRAELVKLVNKEYDALTKDQQTEVALLFIVNNHTEYNDEDFDLEAIEAALEDDVEQYLDTLKAINKATVLTIEARLQDVVDTVWGSEAYEVTPADAEAVLQADNFGNFKTFAEIIEIVSK